jgi:putative spermidine/putrescine transport system permease protein
LVVAFLLLPLVVIVPIGLTSSRSLTFPPPGYSLRWYAYLLSDETWRNSLLLSLQVGLGTVAVSLLLGVPMALGLVRGRFPGRGLTQGLMLSPLVIPSVIVAIGMYSVWAVGWRIGGVGITVDLIGTVPGLVLAHSALAVPYVVVIVSATIRTVDRELELAAYNLGANPFRAFRFITLPLILPGVLAASILAFLTSWDEPVVALFLTSPRAVTLPVRMFVGARDSVDPTVAAVATIVSGVTAVLFLLVLVLRRPAGSRQR